MKILSSDVRNFLTKRLAITFTASAYAQMRKGLAAQLSQNADQHVIVGAYRLRSAWTLAYNLRLRRTGSPRREFHIEAS
jgi:hypothetical protein